MELVKFYSPVDESGVQHSSPNTLGIRHLCFDVDDVEDLVATLNKKHGAGLIGEIQTYADIYQLCYILGLAEEI